MKVLVTGITGFLGQIIARQLLRGGDSVRGFVRSDRAPGVPEIDLARGDLSRPQDIEAALPGVDAVVHCGARVLTHGRWDQFAAVNVEAVRRIIEGARRAGIRRVVHVSSLSVYAVPHDGAVIAEDSPYDEAAANRGFYSRSKLAADRIAMQAAAGGAPVTVIRPGVLYGVGRRPPLGRQSFAVGSLRLILGRPEYLLPLSFGENVAEAISLALHREEAVGRAYTIVDPQVPMRDYLSLYRSTTAASWRAIFVPPAAAMAVVKAAALAFRAIGRNPPVSPHQIERSTWSATFDCSRARAEIGWEARVTLADGLRQSVRDPVSEKPSDAVQLPKYETN